MSHQMSLVDCCKKKLCKDSQIILDEEINDTTIGMAKEYEDSKLFAKGRVIGGVIDGAKLSGYDDGLITIRLDHSKNPEFWSEVYVDLVKLSKWLKEYHDVTVTFK